MKSMATIVPIVLTLLALSFSVSHAASSCYACSDCGTTWDVSKATMIPTAGANDYCRKTVTGSLVNRDSVATCTSANLFGQGIFCCQANLCNSANKKSITMINLGALVASIWAIYHYMY